MKTALILADGASTPPGVTANETLPLRTSGSSQNLRLAFDGLEDQFLQRLPPELRDLLRVAAYVYGADTRILRGTKADVFSEEWPRELIFSIGVEKPDLWNDPQTLEALTTTLGYLTGDVFRFHFQFGKSSDSQQGFLPAVGAARFAGADSVIMFSGGADSLAAVLHALNEGRHPLLVSHRPTPPIDARQRNLLLLIRERYPGWQLPHASIVVNRQDGGGRGKFEPSQRSRSFLFTALGAACASLLDISDVRLCDNGIVSINLPRLDQSYGSMLSRSTHPKYIRSVEHLVRLLSQKPALTIANTLLLKTKRQVMEYIASTGHPELIQETVSCAHVEGKTKHQPHCGVCSQCIDRRFATSTSELAQHDLSSRYEIDIFKDAIPKEADRLQAESYVRFAQKLEKVSDASAFLGGFPDLYDCLNGGDEEKVCEDLFQLFQNHRKTVLDVIDSQVALNVSELRRGNFPETCLIRMVCLGSHLKDPRFEYIERLKGLLCGGFRQSFQTVKAKNERHVQDVAEGLLATAKEALAREVPLLPFATVATKPDFSDKPIDPACPPLFVEFKYVRNRKALNKVVTEITSRIHIYRQQGALSLFVVYDPSLVIVDDRKFTLAHADGTQTWVGIAR